MSDPVLSTLGFSTPEMDEIFSATSFVSAMLEFEGALAEALSDAGIAPTAQTTAIAEVCKRPIADAEAILGTTWEAGTPVIALVDEIKSRLEDEEVRAWVHHGATTQDVIDTAQILLARQGLKQLERSLVRIARRLKELIGDHTGQTQIGRTFLQHARPTTFPHRAASWLQSTLGHIDHMRGTRSQLLVQLGGPVGNLDTYGPKGTEVMEALADRLGLSTPEIPWQTDRTPVWQIVWAVDRPVASIAKMATDVALLAQSDTAELTVRAGGSSSVADKRNPIDAVRALAAADICHGAAEMILGARPHELDRALGSWHVEWVALPLLFRSASAALEAATSMFETMEIDGAAMDSRVGQPPDELDATQVDRVLDAYKRIVEEG